MLTHLSIINFAQKVASSKSVMPAGGCVTALSGLMGVSLIEMAISSSYGYPGAEEFLVLFKKTQVRLAIIHSNLLSYIDKDAEAYNKVIAAYKLKKTTLEEEKRRRAAMQTAALEATEIPLKVACDSIEALEFGIMLLTKVKPSVLGDLQVGLLVSKAGIEGSLTAARLNLSLIKDKQLIKILQSRIDELQSKLDNCNK
ncbi:cyclodeaminase/cyclohydrolase family protein [Sporomusa sp.]|uniref:cyclodeaminase/cyclohydrolase family protein n=1 Tax=Sporomusa sp. TaxID=2078658 RepID=UPI002CD39177|nr:cyclodeaminase/cyclohydrolase family protein [Sporomusa sp.]HWR07923.1 cyclodeaminase/cyclohydrolase family protein [Sporomusa sp.]